MTTPGVLNPSAPYPRRSLAPLVALVAAMRTAINTSIRMIYPFLPLLSGGMLVEIPALTLAVTLSMSITLLAPFLAPVIERRGRRQGLLLGMLLFSLGTALVALHPAYTTFFASMLLINLGDNLFTATSQAYLSDLSAFEHRGRMLALVELSWALSFILGVPLMAALIQGFGWQAPFFALAVAGFVSMLLVVLCLPAGQVNTAAAPHPLAALKQVFSTRSAWAIMTVSAAVIAGNQVVSWASGIWMEDAFQFQVAALGLSSALIGFSELGGEGLAASFLDRVGKKRSIAIGMVVNGLAAVSLPWLGGTIPGAMVWLVWFYLSFEFTAVAILPLVTEIVPGARVTMMAANIAAFSLGIGVGAFLAPYCYQVGFWANALVCVAFDLLALGALGGVRVGAAQRPVSTEITKDGLPGN
ncbi:MAG: MFS transporter [Anaerolineaceae bacterium]|nr:MFS transporter [Anaerolineaceae bacterium]